MIGANRQMMGHFGPENVTSSQFWIGSKNFFKILRNERGRQQIHGNYINGFSEKILFGADGLFRTQNGSSSQLWIRCKDCLTVLHYERGQGKHRNYVNGFSGKKNPIRGNLVILTQKWCVLITLLSCCCCCCCCFNFFNFAQ